MVILEFMMPHGVESLVETYKTDGSHGCINTPLEIMTELYGLVETGTPVIMFY